MTNVEKMPSQSALDLVDEILECINTCNLNDREIRLLLAQEIDEDRLKTTVLAQAETRAQAAVVHERVLSALGLPPDFTMPKTSSVAGNPACWPLISIQQVEAIRAYDKSRNDT